MDLESYTQELEAAFERLDLSFAGSLMEQHGPRFPAETQCILVDTVDPIDNIMMEALYTSMSDMSVNSHRVLSKLCQAAVKRKNWKFVAEAIARGHRDSAYLHLISAGADHVRMFVEVVWDKVPDLGYGEGRDRVCFSLFEGFVDYEAFGLLREVLVLVSKLNDKDGRIAQRIFDSHENVIAWVAFCWITRARYPKATMRAVFKTMSEDERSPCQHLAALLASQLGKWNFLCSAVGSGKVKLLNHLEPIFSRAVSQHAWSCAATMVHRIVAKPIEVEDDDGILQSIRGVAQSIVRKPHAAVLVLKPFVRRCVRLKLFAAGAIMAAWARDWTLVRKMLVHLDQGTHDAANLLVLEEVMRMQQFRMVSEWMGRQPGQKLQPDYINCIAFEASGHLQRPEARAILGSLMCQVNDRMHMERILHNILFYCRADLLSKLLAKDLLHKMKIGDVDYSFTMLIDNIRLAAGDTSLTELPHYKIFLKCFEAGFSTCLSEYRKMRRASFPIVNPFVPVHNAVYRGLMPVIHILYATGVLTHAVVHSLLKQIAKISYYKPKENTEEVMSFLQDVDNTPRSLTNRCCIVLSDLLGCRCDRKERALSLGLPLSLTRKILFLDVLYPKGYDDACDADPNVVIVDGPFGPFSRASHFGCPIRSGLMSLSLPYGAA